MQVRLLGPIEVIVNGESRLIPGSRRQAVLAVLALHCGEVVSTDYLADAIWGDTAPSSALNTLQSHVSFMRGLLGSKAAILARPPGYLLNIPGDGTDVRQAERLLREAARSADAVSQLQAALELWRGDPLAEFADLPWQPAQAERLDQLRSQIRQAQSEARLAAGDHVRLVPELERMLIERPLDERVHGQLMLALYRSGRQADALAAYHRLRQALDDDLGIQPSQFLRDLQAAMLNQDPALNLVPTASALGSTLGPPAGSPTGAPSGPPSGLPPPDPELPVPAQLPSAIAGFTGRNAELAILDARAGTTGTTASTGRTGTTASTGSTGTTGRSGRTGRLGPTGRITPGSATLVAVSGTAGVGKSTLAVHWAHHAAERFPDGQLYVNLRGFDPAGAALAPTQALHGFLDAFGVPAARIPEDLGAQSALFRSLLADKRVLIVLDNARDSEQVRPLLPGSPGCLTLVTSRDQLTGLITSYNAVPLALDLLSAADARELLIRRLGANRVAAEFGAVDRIIAACARLPLALAIAAARAAARPSFPLAAVAAELAEAGRALDPFDGGDRATDVRAVFSWSYQALGDPAARLFRLLGLHPGRDISVASAASLAALPRGRAQAQLAQLTRAHLVNEHAPGRYALHDLLRAYASELADNHDDQAAQDAAVDRVLAHYLHTAHNAAKLMESLHYPVTLGAPPAEVVAGRPATAEEAMAWLATEQPAIEAAVQLAVRYGLSTCAWQLAWTLSTFLLRRGLWSDQAQICQRALSAARRAGDQIGEAHCLQRLGVGYAKSGRVALGKPLLTDALRLFEILGDRPSQAVTHRTLLWIADRRERGEEMLAHSQRCYELFALTGHRSGQALALQDLGRAHAFLGRYDLAIEYCERALIMMREVGELAWEGAAWDTLGLTHHQRGDYREAIACYEHAADLAQHLGDRYNEADAFNSIGDVHHSAGHHDAASRAWTKARQIFDEIDHPDREQVSAKLESPVQQPA
jgi:DNA-binding SARP family transcriptional activator